jgi:hypothetical protein
VRVEVFQDGVATVADEGLFPVKAGFGETLDVDVVGHHSLADVLKINEIILSRDFVWVVHEESCMSTCFRAQGIPIVIVG